MIENPWIAEQEREDAEWAEWDRRHNHWEHDADKELVLDFAYDKEIMHKALALYLNADETEIEFENAERVFGYLPEYLQYAMVLDYIEWTHMQNDFNEWFDEHHGGYLTDGGDEEW